MRFTFVLALAGLLARLSVGQITARLSAEPPLSPAEVANLEATVRASPVDLDTRMQLLRFYLSNVSVHGGARSPFQNDRLGHILYWIQNRPSDPILSTDLMYVPSATGPFADPTDHAAVRDAWLRAVERQPTDTNVVLNATRFLYRERPEEAEKTLSRVLERDPANRLLAANLGFLYALDILGIPTPNGQTGSRSDEDHKRSLERASGELDRSRNVFVLAGAGTALPNLFPRTPQARVPGGGQAVFELASRLMARARELGPNEAELQGPMPLIREFQEFQRVEATLSPSLSGSGPPNPGAQPSTESAIRVGGAVQAAKLIEKPEAVYPPLAMQARIQGNVRFDVIVGLDGRVENVTLTSGHPLFVPVATEAVRQYRYQTTLLNGKPVQVITQVEVPFLMPQ